MTKEGKVIWKEKKRSKSKQRWEKLTSYLSNFKVGTIVERRNILRTIYGHIPGKNPTSIDTYLLMLRGSDYLFRFEAGRYVVDKIIDKNLNYTSIQNLYYSSLRTGVDPSMKELINNLRIAEYLNKNKEI